MDFEKLLIDRRSVRNYKDEDLAEETLMKIIHEAACAPSSGNEQPWRFIVVKNKDFMRKISDDAKKNLLDRIKRNPDDYARKYEKMLGNESFNIFYNAPVLVIITGDNSLKNTTVNCTLAASYFMMSAANNGLGTCWINFATAIKSEELLSALNISAEQTIIAPIIIGYPDKIPDIPKRKVPEIIKIA